MINRTGWMGGLVLGALVLGGAGCEKDKAGDKPAATGDAAAAAKAAEGAAAAPATPATDRAESPTIAELHTLKDAACACKDAACADGVQERVDAFMNKYKDTKATEDEIELANKYAEEMMRCLVKVTLDADLADPAAPPGAAATPPAAAGSTGLPSCDAYLLAVEKFAACDKVPKENRDATRAGVDQMKGAWSQMAGMPEEARKQTDDACKQGLDALQQGAKALGCAL